MLEHSHHLINIKLQEAKEKIQSTDKGIVPIKGKEYSTVGNRLNALRDAFGFMVSIKTEILERSEQKVCIKAEIYFNDTDTKEQILMADGYAEKNRNDSFITKTSCVEFCQTTAVGRALAMLGLLGNNEIASANEMSISGDDNVIEKKDKVIKINKTENEVDDV